MGDEKYRSVNPEEIASYKEWAKKKVKEWHDKFQPDYIVATETAATPLAFLIKSAWKSAYPSEKIPIFLRADPSQFPVWHKDQSNWEEEYKKYSKKVHSDEIIKKYAESIAILPHNEKTRILVFDESSEYGKSPTKVADLLGELWNLEDSSQLKVETTCPSIYNMELGFESFFPYAYDKGHVRPTVKVVKDPDTGRIKKVGYNLRASILHDKNYRGKAQDYIHDLKLAGKEAGLDIRQKSLEGKVLSVIAIAGLVSSFFFLGSSTTGNAIANLSSTATNTTGIILFLIGIVSALFYFKNKKIN
jgi:hypothetical protein